MKKILLSVLVGYFFITSFALAGTALYPEKVYSKNELLGKVGPWFNKDFSRVPKSIATRNDFYIRTETLDAFKKMNAAAKKEGVNLRIVSGMRTFSDQKMIWEDKWNGIKLVSGIYLKKDPADREAQATLIMNYSSMPGISRHHWGTDIDINSVSDYYFQTSEGQRAYEWLVLHADEFGFCQTYTEKDETRPTGYNEEKWHWSYMPLAAEMLKQYHYLVSYSDISGFVGSDTAKTLKVVENYVDSINPGCNIPTV